MCDVDQRGHAALASMRLQGTGASTGIAVGPALLIERETRAIVRLPLAREVVEPEVERLKRAVSTAREQLKGVRAGRSDEGPYAYILDAHLLMLDDPMLLDRTVDMIRHERVNAAWALHTVGAGLRRLFEGLGDAYLKERSTDLDDVLGLIQRNLVDESSVLSLSRLPGPFVVVAVDLSPSEAAALDFKRVLAVATDRGSVTSHTAILARSLGIPLVVGLGDATRHVASGTLVIVDGARGRLEVEPAETTLKEYGEREEEDRREAGRLRETRDLPAVTPDGAAILLRANVEFPEDASKAAAHGAAGIGLFRSEYLLGRDAPSEEKQVEIYRQLLEHVSPHLVTVRLWDLASDSAAAVRTPNPAMGERAIRLARRRPALFVTQLRALLRAGLHGPLRILLPFVSGPSDLALAETLLGDARKGLTRDGLPFSDRVPIGVNLEIPGAALMVDALVPRLDFLSVGTNDLIQYLLAADRADPSVIDYYQPLHPAVLRTIRAIVQASERHGRPVCLCGEMAADPLHAVVLVGLGVRELSMAPSAIPRVKAAIRRVEAARARDVVARCLEVTTASEIETLVRDALAVALAPA